MADKNSDTPAKRLNQLNSQIQNGLLLEQQNPVKSLSEYRQKSTVDPKVMDMLIYGYNSCYRTRTFQVLEKYPSIFKHPHLEEANREAARYLAFRQLVKFNKEGEATYENYRKDPHISTIIGTTIYQWNPAHSIKHGVVFYLFAKTIMNLGTQKHEKLIERALKFDDIGCFALTELGHGSNAKAIQTTATYDSATNEFIIHTPNDMALKWWIGASAELANYSAVWAQLYVNGKHEGVHAFVVPIRSTRDHLPLPGVVIGDCGSKNGLEGIDNGFLQFNYYRVPYDSLLDKLSSIENGVYKSSIPNADKRFGLQLGSLSGGRIGLCYNANSLSMLALTIGIRYACVRKQFGLPKQPEQSIIEYPLVQHRLMVGLAQYVVAQIATLKLNQIWDHNQSKVLDMGNNLINQLHAQSSVLKAITTWQSTKTIQVSREVLGGHGYSSLSRLGVLYNDNDINVTWEGDNNVLLQQTAKFLLEGMSQIMKGKKCLYPTIEFLSIDPAEGITWEATNVQPFRNPDTLLHALEWRVNLLLQRSGLKLQENLSKESNAFDAWNATQVYYLNNSALAYGDVFQAQEFIDAIKTVKHIPTKEFLLNSFELWALNIIITDLGTFRDSDFISSETAQLAKNRILDLIKLLKDEAVGVIDIVAPPDFAIGSPFGASDGDIYKRYLNEVRGSKDCYARVKWWEEIHPQKIL